MYLYMDLKNIISLNYLHFHCTKSGEILITFLKTYFLKQLLDSNKKHM